MARRKHDDNCIVTSLNNLGVVYRKLDKSQTAAEVFREARAIARKQENFASECMAANNLALALIDMGSLAGARQILQKVARESAERGLHGECAWALGELASLDVYAGRDQPAEKRYRQALTCARRSGSAEVLCRVTLNHASLLSHVGKPDAALRLLESVEAEASHLPHAFQYFEQLAVNHEEVGDDAKAEEAWIAAGQAAMKADRKEYLAKFGTGVACTRIAQHKFRMADRAFAEACNQAASARDNLNCRIAYMGALLHARRWKAAERVFEEARSLTLRHKLVDVYVRLHGVVGDCYWRNDVHGRLEGSKAFIAAMTKAIDIGLEEYISVGTRLFVHLMLVDRPQRAKTAEQLRKQLLPWLRGQEGGADDDVLLRTMLWPLRLAENCPIELSSFVDLSHRQVEAFFETEIKNILTSQGSKS